MENSLILGISTSGKRGGLALYIRGEYIELSFTSRIFPFSKFLPFLCDEIFKDFGIDLKEINYYAVDVGPGSFTGLRIGIALIKALYLVHPRPIIPILSLEALSCFYSTFVEKGSLIFPVVDAYTGEVFIAGYLKKDEELEEIFSPSLVKLKKLSEFLKSFMAEENKKIYLFSESTEKFTPFLKDLDGVVEVKKVFLSPQAVIRCGLYKVERKKVDFLDGETLLPFYLKPSEAERKRRT